MDAHLLTFQASGEAEAQHYRVGALRHLHGLGLERFGRCGPQELQLGLAVGFFSVHAEAVAPASLQQEGLGLREAGVGEFPVVRRIHRLHHEAVVQVELELDGADQRQTVRPRMGWPQRTRPAHAEVIDVHVGARRPRAPVRIQRRVHPHEQGRA